MVNGLPPPPSLLLAPPLLLRLFSCYRCCQSIWWIALELFYFTHIAESLKLTLMSLSYFCLACMDANPCTSPLRIIPRNYLHLSKPSLNLDSNILAFHIKIINPSVPLNYCLFHSLLDANNANSQNKMFVPPTHAYTKLPCWPPCMIHSSVFIRVEGRLKSQRMIVIGPLMPYFSCREHIPKPAQGCVQTFLITSL